LKKKETLQAFLHHLLHRNIEDWNPRRKLETDALEEARQAQATLSKVLPDEFSYMMTQRPLRLGMGVVGEGQRGQQIPLHTLQTCPKNSTFP